MKFASLFSGGKDSVYATYLAKKEGNSIECLIAIVSKNPDSKKQEFWILSQKRERGETGKGAGHSTTGMSLLAEDPDFSKLSQCFS